MIIHTLIFAVGIIVGTLISSPIVFYFSEPPVHWSNIANPFLYFWPGIHIILYALGLIIAKYILRQSTPSNSYWKYSFLFGLIYEPLIYLLSLAYWAIQAFTLLTFSFFFVIILYFVAHYGSKLPSKSRTSPLSST